MIMFDVTCVVLMVATGAHGKGGGKKAGGGTGDDDWDDWDAGKGKSSQKDDGWDDWGARYA